jgi:putative sterol carrier protein
MIEMAVELFSEEWCEKACALWDEVTFPHLVDPDNYNYVAEFQDTDTGNCATFKAEHGKIVDWVPGKTHPDEECDFILSASRDNWRKVAEGKLDPVGAVAAKRIHVKKGPMPVVVKEAKGFSNLLAGYGRIDTNW